jgi:HEAT repeat protein
MKKIYFFAMAFALTSSILFAQTIEDKLLKKKEQRILNYYYQAKTGGRSQKVNVLESILAEYDENRYSENDQKLVDLVVYLSQEGSTRQEFESNRLVNDFPEVRRAACLVLAKIGGEQSRRALIDAIANDASTTVRAEALNSLAKIKDNQKNEVLRAIVFMYRSSYKPDPNLIIGIINAISTIARGNAEVYGDAILILSEIQVGQYPRTIREAAFNAIKKLNSAE